MAAEYTSENLFFIKIWTTFFAMLFMPKEWGQFLEDIGIHWALQLFMAYVLVSIIGFLIGVWFRKLSSD